MSTFTVTPLREVARAALPALTNMFSPTKNPCMVKTTPMKGTRRFRYDPYRAAVLVPTPEKAQSPVSFAAPFIAAAFPTYHAGAATAFAPYPQMPLVAPMAAYTAAFVPSCESTPAPSQAPSRLMTPVPTIAPVHTIEHMAGVLSSSVSSVASDAKSDTSSTKEAVKHYAIVKFKHDTYPYEAPFRVAVGDSVIVQGDRGDSIGIVRDITTTKPVRPVASSIVRKASQKDKDQLAMLRRKEAAATKFCENAVKDLSIDMSIVDTEYQFDQNKLSIYFKSKGMVDFRRLQRVLFREFRCRVWLVNWNELINDA